MMVEFVPISYLPLLSPFSWPMKTTTKKAGQETTRAMVDETDPLILISVLIVSMLCLSTISTISPE